MSMGRLHGRWPAKEWTQTRRSRRRAKKWATRIARRVRKLSWQEMRAELYRDAATRQADPKERERLALLAKLHEGRV